MLEWMDFGWNEFFDEAFRDWREQGFTVGRIAAEFTHQYRVLASTGELSAEVTGKFRFDAADKSAFPAVGDWVVLRALPGEQRAMIHAVLPRRSQFVRKVAGFAIEPQVVAANVDTVFLVTALDHNFNLRRIERALILAWESGATPVIVLSKADLCADVQDRIDQVESIAPGTPVHAISSVDESGLDDLSRYLQPGRTVALLGSSGAGKSTLINHLAGASLQRVGAVRAGDDHGRHTTTHRELMPIPCGALVIDTPGMRELQLWGDEGSVHAAFDDIETLAAACLFRDCRHRDEPGCRVRAAIEEGALSQERFRNYVKTQRELAHLEAKTSVQMQREKKAKYKRMSQSQRAHPKRR